uniref:NADH-ubiquinone oxidoreductase chain 2 n=1 Tax=Bovicola caprae TaxID=1647116 RepID=A0A3P8MXI2_9NEOP|nr:NADH dehydrogenase subunit 2 [Bovicola caprae]
MAWSLSYFLGLLLGLLVSMSGEGWLSVWWAMEALGLLFLSWMCLNSSLSERGDSSVWTYYLVQSLGGLSVLLGLSSSFLLTPDSKAESSTCLGDNFPFELVAFFGIMLKLGIPPFHGWMIRLSENLSWKQFYVLMATQKVIPLILSCNLSSLSSLGSYWLSFSAVFCSITSLQGVAESSIRRFLSYSSIMNLGWVLLSLTGSSWSNSLKFFLVYLLVMFLVCQTLTQAQVSSSSQSIGSRFYRKSPSSVLTSVLIITLMGIPPFPVFLVKIEILRDSLASGLETCAASLIISTVLLILGYIRLVAFEVMGSPSSGSEMIFSSNFWILSILLSFFLPIMWIWIL